MCKVFKMLADAIYVWPTRGNSLPRVHATTPPSDNTEPGGFEMSVYAYFTCFYKNYWLMPYIMLCCLSSPLHQRRWKAGE